MDIRWFTCMVWVFLHKYINAMVDISTTIRPSSPAISSIAHVPISSRNSRTEQLVTPSRFHGHGTIQLTSEHFTTATRKTTQEATRSPSFFHTQKTDFSTLRINSPLKTKLPPIHKSTPTIPPHRVTITTLRYSTYVPIVDGKKSKTNGIPLIILVPSAAGGGVLLILIIILCCCHRRLKRKKNERIFQKYYRPTLASNSLNDLEDDNSNMWDSQMKLSIGNKEEQSIDSKPFQGLSNKAFATSESLPEMNVIEKSTSDLPVESQNDTEHSTSNNVEDLDIQEIKLSEVSNDCGPSPVQEIPERTIVMNNILPAKENCSYDDHRASLLILQNLDDVLNNECLGDENELEGETSDVVTTLTDNQDKKDDSEYFIVVYPFLTSNTDELSLDIGSTVSVIDSKPSGWSWVANQDGDTGWFPTQYLAHLDTDQTPDESEDVHTNHQIGYSIPDQRRLQFAVLQSFSGSSPDELSLAKYDIVSVIENSSAGWSWVYEASVGSGWFPTNYLEPLVFPKKDDITRTSSSESTATDYLDVIDEDIQYVYASSEEIQKVKKEGHYQEYEAKAYRASHAYTSSNEDELTFKESETILVLQETDTGWWRGSTYLREGWFPATFVEDPITYEDTTITVNTNQPSLSTIADSYEYVDAKCQEDCKKYSEKASPYEVTELVTQRNQSNIESDRETVHQVPQAISKQAAKKHKSRGKASVLRPHRPAPPPPSGSRHLASRPPPAVPAAPLPQVIQTAPLTQGHSAASRSSTVEARPSPQALQADPLSSNTLPSPLPAFPTSPALKASPIPQTSPAQSTHTNIQENEVFKESGNVEGVVIVHPRDQSRDTLSKLIKVTKRRSVINPNPRELPPNRPVPIPPPRKARNPSKSTGNHPSPRPIKLPRNLRNKEPDVRNINNLPKHDPERPPPPLPGKLDEFWRKRLSSSEGSSTEQQLNKKILPQKQAASNNENNTFSEQNADDVSENIVDMSSQPIPKQRNSKPSNGEEVQSLGNKKNEMASADTGKVSPKPKPRKRSRDHQQETQMLVTEIKNRNSAKQNQSRSNPRECGIDRNKEEQNTKADEEGKIQEDILAYQNPISQSSRKSYSPDRRRVSAPEAPLRSHSLSEEASDNEPKTRPEIKPRSKSMANLFSSTGNEQNSEREATSESQPRSIFHSLRKDNSLMSDSHDQVQYDNNQNIAKIKSSKPLPPSFPSPPRPKPKTRPKQDDREIQV